MAENEVEIVIGVDDKTDKAFKGIAKRMKKLSKSALRTAKRIGAIGAALAAIAKTTSRAGDQFQKMSKRLGVSAKALSELKFAAELSGTSIETLEIGFRTLAARMKDVQQGLQESKRTFDELGIAVEDDEGKLKSLDAVFMESVDAINSLKSETEKAALAQELFGRSGGQLLPLIKSGAAGIKEMRKEAERLGITFTDFEAEQSAAFEDALTRLKGSFIGLKNVIGLAIIPAFTLMADRMKDSLVGLQPRVEEFSKNFGIAILVIPRLVQDVSISITANINKLLSSSSSNFEKFLESTFNGFTSFFVELGGFISDISESLFLPIMVSFEAVGGTLVDIWGKAMDVIRGRTDEFTIDLASIFERNLKESLIQSGEQGAEAIDGIADSLLKIKNEFSATFAEIETTIGGVTSRAVEGASADIQKLVDSLKKAFETDLPDSAKKGTDAAFISLQEWLGKLEEPIKMFQSATQQAFNDINVSIGDAFAEAIVEGKALELEYKAIMKRIAKSIISTLVQIATRQAVFAIFLGASTSGGSSALGGISSGGNVASASTAGGGSLGVSRVATPAPLPTPQPAQRSAQPQSGGGVVIQNLNILPGAQGVDASFFNKSRQEWKEILSNGGLLDAMNDLGTSGATTTMPFRRKVLA